MKERDYFLVKNQLLPAVARIAQTLEALNLNIKRLADAQKANKSSGDTNSLETAIKIETSEETPEPSSKPETVTSKKIKTKIKS